MPDGFSSKDVAKPPGRRELARADKELTALEIYYRTGELKAVRDGIPSCQSIAQANILVQRGIARFNETRAERIEEAKVIQDMAIREIVTLMMDAVRNGDLTRAKELMPIFDRHSKLLGLDEKRDEVQTGPQIVVNVGLPDIPDRPALPDPNMIEGEVVE